MIFFNFCLTTSSSFVLFPDLMNCSWHIHFKYNNVLLLYAQNNCSITQWRIVVLKIFFLKIVTLKFVSLTVFILTMIIIKIVILTIVILINFTKITFILIISILIIASLTVSHKKCYLDNLKIFLLKIPNSIFTTNTKLTFFQILDNRATKLSTLTNQIKKK